MNSFPEVHEENPSRNSFIVHCWHQVGRCGKEPGLNTSGPVWERGSDADDVDGEPSIKEYVLGGEDSGMN